MLLPGGILNVGERLVFTHTKCGGTLNIVERRCIKCGKRWPLLLFWFSPRAIRPVRVKASSDAYRKVEKSEAESRSKYPAIVYVFPFAIPVSKFLQRMFPFAKTRKQKTLIIVGVYGLIIFGLVKLLGG